MGSRGPQPIDKQILKLRRSWRANLPENCPILPAKHIRCPGWLSADGRAEWRRLSPIWYDLGLLNELTRIWWTLFCSAWTDFLLWGKMLEDLRRQPNVKPLLLKRIAALKYQAADQITTMLRTSNLQPKPRPRQKTERTKARFFDKPRDGA